MVTPGSAMGSVLTLMTVWGILVLASLAGTRSASSDPFHWRGG